MEHNDISTRVIKEYAVQNRINHFKFSYCTILDYKEHVIKSFKGSQNFQSVLQNDSTLSAVFSFWWGRHTCMSCYLELFINWFKWYIEI